MSLGVCVCVCVCVWCSLWCNARASNALISDVENINSVYASVTLRGGETEFKKKKTTTKNIQRQMTDSIGNEKENTNFESFIDERKRVRERMRDKKKPI